MGLSLYLRHKSPPWRIDHASIACNPKIQQLAVENGLIVTFPCRHHGRPAMNRIDALSHCA
jgi:hypothetical protein